MLLCITLLFLLGLSACTVAGDKKLAVDAEVGSWVAMTLEPPLNSKELSASSGRCHPQHPASAPGHEEGESKPVLWANGEAGRRKTSHPVRGNRVSARTTGPGARRSNYRRQRG
ncbi:tachykinin-4 isoform X2 [Budorcas taxicolor]|uniref:tachykinin-4 isoform X2 n=1 Tax=Budorcas taxicolor TaxID=37181 RepID=UPI002283B1DE|nr:tachykinin-4 isoform X2 [Budorcas taxicolor]